MFADELKLKLGRLTHYHHLFFTFYNATCSHKKEKRVWCHMVLYFVIKHTYHKYTYTHTRMHSLSPFDFYLFLTPPARTRSRAHMLFYYFLGLTPVTFIFLLLLSLLLSGFHSSSSSCFRHWPLPLTQTVIGYAFAPLYKDGRLVIEDRMKLPIAAELPNRYLDPSSDSQIKVFICQ